MNSNIPRDGVRLASWRWRLSLGLLCVSHAAFAQLEHHAETAWIRTTNYAPRFITNVIKVSIPTNSFYDEYRTNWVRQRITNVVDVFRTNLATEFRTNLVPVTEFRTNVQIAYTTNLKDITLTNLETVLLMRTNWITSPMTNIVDFTNTIVAQRTQTNLVTAFATNLVVAWQTNMKVLTLTNWQTVLVMKTNWINVPVTNVVQLDIPASRPEPVLASESRPAPVRVEPVTSPAPTLAVGGVDLAGGLEFQLTRTAKPLKPDQNQIRLVLRKAGVNDAILPVQEWRVEKADGAAFMIGSRAEFTGSLPAGNYRITARLRGPDNVLRTVRGEIEVATDGSPQSSPGSLATPR